MGIWQELRFIIVDGWKSRGEARDVGASKRRALRDAMHTAGGRNGGGFAGTSKGVETILDSADRYDRSFDND